MNTQETQPTMRHHRRTERIEDGGQMRTLRQVLNTVFIVMAAAGMALYYTAGHTIGTYVLIAACVLKFIEVTLRIMKL